LRVKTLLKSSEEGLFFNIEWYFNGEVGKLVKRSIKNQDFKYLLAMIFQSNKYSPNKNHNVNFILKILSLSTIGIKKVAIQSHK
jgi:hypothetical protein